MSTVTISGFLWGLVLVVLLEIGCHYCRQLKNHSMATICVIPPTDITKRSLDGWATSPSSSGPPSLRRCNDNDTLVCASPAASPSHDQKWVERYQTWCPPSDRGILTLDRHNLLPQRHHHHHQAIGTNALATYSPFGATPSSIHLKQYSSHACLSAVIIWFLLVVNEVTPLTRLYPINQGDLYQCRINYTLHTRHRILEHPLD